MQLCVMIQNDTKGGKMMFLRKNKYT